MKEPTVDDYKRVQRQLMWDLMCHDKVFDPEVQRQVGCAPASLDVMEAEHDAADERALRIRPLMYRVMFLSAISATIVCRTDLVDEVATGSDSDQLASLTTMLASGAVAVLSDLMDAGVLVVREEA